jgi:glycerol kinase
MFGTVDSWLLWHLTGGTDGGVHATDPSNASRTMLFDIDELDWSDELLELFGIPRSCLPAVLPSSGRFGTTVAAAAAGLTVPVSGIAGDQQAALFGQACFEPGMTKNTYGTGSFVLMNLGPDHPPTVDGLLTSVAWQVGDATTYVLEGAIFVTGAAVQWLRDGLGIIADAAETGPLAESVPDTGGVVFVPAFTGLGSPYWDPYARGSILGLTRGSGRAHLARAVVEAMAHQTADVVDAMTSASGREITELRADGGASVMDLLCQFQADVLGVPVRRPAVPETTAVGAAYLAGIAEGIWGSPAEAAAAWREDAVYEPAMAVDEVRRRRDEWRKGVQRARGWATDTPPESS